MDVIYAILRSMTPLLFPSLGGLISERSGVINIALEGFMLFGAFFGAWLAFNTGSPWIGWFSAIAIGCAMASLYALFVIELKVDQIVAGTAFNLLSIGFIPFLSKIVFNSTGSTPSLSIENRFTYEPYVFALVTTIIVCFVLLKTRFGLWNFVAGEHPLALKSSGVSVRKVRWLSVIASGGLAACGGATLSLALASSYSPLMTAGRGFIALAALITAKWKPIPTIFACVLFSLVDVLQTRWQGIGIGQFVLPAAWIQILPYILTLLVLAGFVGQSRPPKSLGRDLEGKEIK